MAKDQTPQSCNQERLLSQKTDHLKSCQNKTGQSFAVLQFLQEDEKFLFEVHGQKKAGVNAGITKILVFLMANYHLNIYKSSDKILTAKHLL